MNTSYFAQLKRIANPLSICGKAPNWYSGPQYKVLAPKYDFLMAYKEREIDSDEYTACFNTRVLKPLDAKDVYKHLTKTYGKDLVMLCYERPGEFCHRRIVAEWFETELGIKVPELKFK